MILQEKYFNFIELWCCEEKKGVLTWFQTSKVNEFSIVDWCLSIFLNICDTKIYGQSVFQNTWYLIFDVNIIGLNFTFFEVKCIWTM